MPCTQAAPCPAPRSGDALATGMRGYEALPAGMRVRMTSSPTVTRSPFGTLADGTPVERLTLSSGRGMSVGVLTLGGIVQAVEVPDREVRTATVAVGFAVLACYRSED